MADDTDDRMHTFEDRMRARGATMHDPEPPKRPNGATAGNNPAGSKADTGEVELLNFREYRAKFKSTTAMMAIQGLFRFGTLVGVGARPSGGKTGLTVHLCDCFADGKSFLGRETVQAVVAYIGAEDQEDVVNRLEATDNENIFAVVAENGLPLTKPDLAKRIVLKVIARARQRRPGLPVVIVVDTFRAALGTQSVMEDKYASPALNALREVAERENVLVIVLNHTNRENPKQMKGETLEAVAATELVIVKDGESGWHDISVGKNRCGPSHYKIGRMSFTSVEIEGVNTSIIKRIVPDGTASQNPDERRPGKNQKLVIDIVKNLMVGVPLTYPLGADGPCARVVPEPEVREEFIRRRAGDDRREKGKRFNETLQSLLDNETLVRTEKPTGEGMLWFADRKHEHSPSEWDEDEP